MIKPLRPAHITYIEQWLEKMQDGDRIVRRGNDIILYNDGGFCSDCITIY